MILNWIRPAQGRFIRNLEREKEVFAGWLPDELAQKQFLTSTPKPRLLQYDLVGEGETALLWRYYEQLNGTFVPRDQALGDCVGQAAALACDIMTSIVAIQNSTAWIGHASSEAIYAGSRIEIGKGRICFSRFGRPRDGSNGAWAMMYLREYGTLPRAVYATEDGAIDLRTYRPDLAKEWGYSSTRGVPDELETYSRQYRIVAETSALTESWDGAKRSVLAGYPVLLTGGLGFNRTAESNGLHLPSRKPTWHAWTLIGVDRDNACIASSWGDYFRGKPYRIPAPKGCFWTQARYVDKLLEHGDSFAMSPVDGFPTIPHKYELW